MLSALRYWILLTAFGTVHLHFFFTSLSWNVPIYLTGPAVIGLVYYVSKKILLQIDSLGLRWNIFLFAVQLLLIVFYFTTELSWFAFIPFIVFISLELVRLLCSMKIAAMERRHLQFEEQREHINETFRLVRSERHDFLKHVSAVHFMLENDQNKEAKQYLDELVGGYEETNLSIKGERGVVAGILHQTYRKAQSSGISIVYDLDVPISSLPISDQNIVILLGNLLENSLDACEEWQNQKESQPILTLQCYKRSGLYLLVCKNSTPSIPTDLLDKLYKTYGHSTKSKDHQGLGTKVIMDIVEKHGGFLDFVYKNEEFMVKIKVPAIR
ncbi:sensor histidine kinase [Sutcliffiella deserti]|uniref:sensor histidine kinase n=1 Tax=Sutcliffiella deserti TaxID=2875501 RepID=UPI001CBAB49B|nr:GHKL domain-containing protein [Sutcliffiella deserti]